MQSLAQHRPNACSSSACIERKSSAQYGILWGSRCGVSHPGGYNSGKLISMTNCISYETGSKKTRIIGQNKQ
jgi:hypothetical protein